MPKTTPTTRIRVRLVTGPARSGKSEWAETLASQSNKPITYIATAITNPADPEWQARIDQHIQRRPIGWQTREVPIDLAAAIRSADLRDCLLIDSLGTWLANLIEQDDQAWGQVQAEFLQAVQASQADLIIVAEETGWGLVPTHPIGRLWRDRLGGLTRNVARIADRTDLVVAGYALDLSHLGQPVGSQSAAD
jgi:adenosylcobinamide kinase / adenosylcobinamide-phosphate guanylyltransferase